MNVSVSDIQPSKNFTPTILLLVSLFLFTGCAQFTEMTSSKQWISMPVGTTNGIKNLITPPAHIKAGERAIVGDSNAAMMDILIWNSLGTVNCEGPSDITREVTYDPTSGKIHIKIQTCNSSWLGSMFGGVKDGLKFGVDAILSAVGAATNKI